VVSERCLKNIVKPGGVEQNISPQALRHFFLTWLKKQGVEDEAIQPYSGYEKPQSLEFYTKVAMEEVQHTYDKKIKDYPV